MLRRCTSPTGSARILAALQALDREPYAPRLYAHHPDEGGGELIAMEEVDGKEPEPEDVQQNAKDFIDVLRSLHTHTGFGNVVDRLGRTEPPGFDYPRATERRWQHKHETRELGEGLERAAAWIQRLRSLAPVTSAGSIQVAGHGDMHLPNWRIAKAGPVLLDWEDIRRFELAVEIAPFLVFAGLDPRDTALLYGVPPRYGPAVEAQARWCAVYLFLVLLDTRTAKTNAKRFRHVADVCERWLGS